MRPCSWVLCCSGGPARCCQCRDGWDTGMQLLPVPWLKGQLSIPSLPSLQFLWTKHICPRALPQKSSFMPCCTSSLPASWPSALPCRFSSRKVISAESSWSCAEASGHRRGDAAACQRPLCAELGFHEMFLDVPGAAGFSQLSKYLAKQSWTAQKWGKAGKAGKTEEGTWADCRCWVTPSSQIAGAKSL